MNATHRVTRFSSVISLLTQFSGNLQLDASYRNEAYDDKGNILRWKLERIFPRNFLVMCEFISQSYTYVSWRSPLILSLRNLRMASLDRIEAYAEKLNIISSKRESFWETSVRSVNSSHRVAHYNSGNSLLTIFSWNLQSDIWEPIGGNEKKEISWHNK